MKSETLFRLLILLTLLNILGCTPSTPPEPVFDATLPFATSIDTEGISETHDPALEPSPATTLDFSSLGRPVLLIQTEIDHYLFLNPVSQVSIAFQPPISNPQFRLKAHISPSSRRMFFPLNDYEGIIIDLRTGETLSTYEFGGPALFIPQQAAIEAAPLVTELNLTDTALLEAVMDAHKHSKQLTRWGQSDRYHFSVQDTGPTSTCLFLDDHQTGERIRLENLPGMVENFSLAPDGNSILLKKGLVLRTGALRDKRHYLINLADQSVQSLLLPPDVNNPSFSWFAEDTIALTDQTTTSRNAGFFLINTNSFTKTPIFTDEFEDLWRLGDHLIFVQRELDPEATLFHSLSLAGDLLGTNRVERHCFHQFSTPTQILFQCDLESYLLDQALIIEPFYDAVLTLTPAPDKSAYVMINRAAQIFLLDADLQCINELILEETPLEILWHPDACGFLYRAHGRLYDYDLLSQTSHLLIKSDLFTDYTNLNAVWINLD